MGKTILLSSLLCCVMAFGQIEPTAIYNLKNPAHLSFLNVAGDKGGDHVIHTKDNANVRAKWQLINNGAGFYKIQNVYNKLYIANGGSKQGNAPLVLQKGVGAGGLWAISGNASTKFLLKNKLSGYYLSSAGRRNENAVMVQGPEGQYSYWDLVKVSGGTVDTSKKATNKIESAKSYDWKVATLPRSFYGKWRIYSKVSSRNDVSINGQYIIDGAMTKRIVSTYLHNGVYKIITTYNNYFSSYFVKERVGGFKNGGIYINSTVSHGFRSEKQAYDLDEPERYDMGYKD